MLPIRPVATGDGLTIPYHTAVVSRMVIEQPCWCGFKRNIRKCVVCCFTLIVQNKNGGHPNTTAV